MKEDVKIQESDGKIYITAPCGNVKWTPELISQLEHALDEVINKKYKK